MKPRMLAHALRRALQSFPAVVVTGPRQSGKTTLLKTLFSKTHRFVSLEDPDVRLRAKEDPLAFLDAHRPPVVIDEIQYLPELLSYVKTRIDQRRTPGQWLFTGSQNFVLMQGVSQSLAGRVAVLSLLPFSLMERAGRGEDTAAVAEWLRGMCRPRHEASRLSLSDVLLRGSYPEIASKRSVDRQLWCGSYIATYLERDVRNLAQIGDLSQFERFLRLCAARTGQLLNLTAFANDIGVSVPTAKRWLSILETSHQIYLLYPYYKNIGKRLVKSPKLYLTDTGLASYLMGLHEAEALLKGPSVGPLFETLVVTEVLKRFLHAGQMPSLYYLRTRDGLEVDLVLELNQQLHLFEIKSAMTVVPKHAASLRRLVDTLGSSVHTAGIISASSETFPLSRTIMNYGWRHALVR